MGQGEASSYVRDNFENLSSLSSLSGANELQKGIVFFLNHHPDSARTGLNPCALDSVQY